MAFADFDLTDRQRVDKRILHWTGTPRLFQIGVTIEKPCARLFFFLGRVGRVGCCAPACYALHAAAGLLPRANERGRGGAAWRMFVCNPRTR